MSKKQKYTKSARNGIIIALSLDSAAENGSNGLAACLAKSIVTIILRVGKGIELFRSLLCFF